MGLSEQWLAVRVSSFETSTANEALSDVRLRVLHERDGWIWADGWPAGTSLDELVAQIAARCAEPVIGAWVFDSDFGYLVGASPEGSISFRLAVNPAYDMEDDDQEAELLRLLWSDPRRRRECAENLAEWSTAYAPRAVSAADVLSLMPVDEAAAPAANDEAASVGRRAWSEADDGTQQWLFAEDGMRLLFESLGFPALDDNVFGPADEAPEAPQNPFERLHIQAPDMDSATSLYNRLLPTFADHMLVTGPLPYDDAAFAETPPSDPPEWLDDLVAEISGWLAETGIEQVRASLSAPFRAWTIRSPLG